MLMVARTATEPPPLPDAPTNLVLSAASQTTLDVAWDDNATDEIAYELEVATDAGFGDIVFSDDTLAVDSESDTVTGLIAGATYYVRVRCRNVTGDSAWLSNSVVMPGDPPQRIDSVGGVATATNAMRLFWTNVGDEDYFELARATTSNFDTGYTTTTVPANTLHYDWTVASNTWYVRVRGVSAAKGAGTWRGYSNNSASGDYEAEFGFVRVPSSLASPPTAPTGLSITVDSANQLTIDWTEGSGGGFSGTQVIVARDASYEDVVYAEYDSASAEQFVATGLDGNTEYFVRIRSVDGTAGDFSAWVEDSESTAPSAVPSAPTGLAVTTAAPTTLDWGWTDPAGQQITEVEAQIATNLAFDANLQTDTAVGVGTETKQWTGLTEGVLYYSRVRAVNAAGDGAYNTQAGYTQYAAPTSLAANDNDPNWLLEWTRNSGNNGNVEIHRDTGSGYALFDTLEADTVEYTVAKASGVKWKVRNVGAGVASDYSNEFTDPT